MKVFIIILLLLISCNQYGKVNSRVCKSLEGSHELRKLQTKENSEFKLSGAFFLVAGGIDAKSETIETVLFSWKDNDNNYIISKLPLTKFRIKIDNTIKNPYIKFKWRFSFSHSENDMELIMKNNVIYVLLVCSEKDYPKNLNFNGVK
jgi:hypothetical protein